MNGASSEATGEQPKEKDENIRSFLCNHGHIIDVCPICTSTPDSLQAVLMGCANLLDTIKGEWGDEWSDWDQSIRDGITSELRKIADKR